MQVTTEQILNQKKTVDENGECQSCGREYGTDLENDGIVNDICPADDCPSLWEDQEIKSPEFPKSEVVS